MRRLLFISIILTLTACQKPSRDNPWDDLSKLDPQEWAPKNLQINSSNLNHPVISWEYSADNRIEGFKIDRKRGNEPWKENYATINAFTFIFSDTITPDNQTIYTYRITTFAGNIKSQSIEANTMAVIPAPENFSVSNISDVSFLLSWQFNNTGHDGFILERSISEGPFTLIDTLSPETRQFSDSSFFVFKASNKFQYRIFTYLKASRSVFAELNTDFLLPPPTNLNLYKNSLTSVTLSWGDNSNGEQGFFIEMNINNGIWWIPVTMTQNSTITINNLTPNTNLFFRVSAFYENLFSTHAVISTDTQIPPPSNVTLNVHNSNALILNWVYNFTGQQGFSIDRKRGDEPWEVSYAVLDNQTFSWIDEDIYPDSTLTYQYQITAFINEYESPKVLVTLQPFKPPYIMDGLIGWWPFNGNTSDESNNANHGINNGATLTTDRFNNSNSAFNFDGNDWIEVNNQNIQFPNGITISLWAKLNNSEVAQFLISKGQDNQSGHIQIQFSESLEKFGAQLNSLTAGNGILSNQFPTPHSSWYNIVLTYDNQTEKLYVNGILNNTVAYNTPISNLTSKFLFGKHSMSLFPYYTKGKLDDIGIWNRALNQDEITALFELN